MIDLKNMTSKNTPDLLPGTLELMILKTLSIGTNHGYGIARRIKQTSGNVLQVEEGSLYPALHRLEKRGYLDHEWGQSESNRRAKYYKLSRSGRARLRSKTKNWTLLTTAIGKVMNANQEAFLSAGSIK